MLMMSRRKNLNQQGDVILRNEAIQRVTKTKFLGVIVDQHLNWKDHISMVAHKISKSCGIISRIRNTLDIKSKKNVFIIVSYTHILLTVSMSGPLPLELIENPYVQPKKGQSVHSLLLHNSPIREIPSSIKKICLWIN